EQTKNFVISWNQNAASADLVLFHNSCSQDTLNRLQSFAVKLTRIRYNGFGAENRWSRLWPLLRHIAKLPVGNKVRSIIYKQVLTRMIGHRISCCGTIIGTVDGMIDYLSSFFDELCKLKSLTWGADTSVHNVVIREVLKNRVLIKENIEGAVATLGNEHAQRL